MLYNYGSGSAAAHVALVHGATKLPGPGAIKLGGRRRQRLSLRGMVLSLIVPWVFFVGLFQVVAFSTHYTQPALCWALVGGALLLTFVPAYYASEAVLDWLARRFASIEGVMSRIRGLFGRHNDVDFEHLGLQEKPPHAPSWLAFLFFTMLLAWCIAVGLGHHVFASFYEPYHRMADLGTHVNVRPGDDHGQQMLDAGAVVFAVGSRLDTTKAASFRSSNVYCVAPVTEGNATLASYDFWAVGKDCCQEGGRAWRCQGFDDPRGAVGGVRLMSDHDRAFYRLAVQQAAAAYGIYSEHPLFFSMTRDPDAIAGAIKENGDSIYRFAVVAHFVAQACAVLVTAYIFMQYGGV